MSKPARRVNPDSVRTRRRFLVVGLAIFLVLDAVLIVLALNPRVPVSSDSAQSTQDPIADPQAGTTPEGTAYEANDPRLLDWVQATASFGFVQAYHLYARPLSAAEKDRAFAEAAPAARLYGATGAPGSWADWERMLAATAPGLEGSDILADFMRIMGEAPILPAPARWLQRLLVRAAVEITPEPVCSLPQLRGRGLRFGEAAIVRAMGRGAALLPLADTPPAEAARRLELAENRK